MQESKKQNFLKGAAILAAASIFVKIVGAIYKIPIARMLGDEGTGYFQVTYNIYTLMLTISTAGIPVALSRMVSSAAAHKNTNLVKRYFSVALPAFITIGTVAMILMFVFADTLAGFMNSSPAAYGIRVIAPAVLFVCLISVYRGYAQGYENMVPTAMSQVVEVISKAAFGITAAFWLAGMGYGLHIVSASAILGVTIGAGLCVPMLIWFKRKIDRGIVYSSGEDPPELPGKASVLVQLMKVSIPITLGASFISIMTVIDTSIVLGRLQSALHLTESQASAQFGIYTKGLMVYNLPPAFIVPVAISIIPAIAAALAKDRRDEASSIMQSSIKLTNLLAMPACAGLMVLAGPILKVLFYDPDQSPEAVQTMTTILVILGAASFFVCFQHVTTAILQANGYERIALMTFPVGAVFKIVLGYVLVAIPSIGVIGSAIGTLVCFSVITLLNILFILFIVKEKPKFINVVAKPLLCTSLMAVAAYFSYELLYMIGKSVLGEESGSRSIAVTVYLAGAIFTAVLVYAILVIVTRTVTKEDIALVPKSEKLAKLLRVR